MNNICPICNIRERRHTTKVNVYGDCCLVCNKEKKVRDKYQSDDHKFKECIVCKQLFNLGNKNEKECRKCLEFKSIRKSNENWLVRKPRTKNKMTSDQVAYSFFKKKYTVPNNVFRG